MRIINTIFQLENRYIPSFILIIVLLCLAYLNTNEMMQSISNDGKIINMSGKQRMLSQKVLIETTRFLDNNDTNSKKEILKIIDEMQSSHDYLLSFPLSDKLIEIYIHNSLTNDLIVYLESITKIVNGNGNISLKRLTLKSEQLLKKLDTAVKIYEQEYQDKIRTLKIKERIIYILIIFLLIILAIFYFYPASKKIKQNKKQLENEIYEKTRELQYSIDIISKNVIYSRTDLKGIITYASEAFCDISGFSKAELLGKPHNIIRHPDMPKKAFKEMWNIISKEEKWQGEVKNLTKDGGYYWVEAHIYPEYDLDSNHIGYAAIRHDITHKKALKELNQHLEAKIANEVEKNRLKEQTLFEQSKRVQISQMIENIAHHWRQPLNIISVLTSGLIFKLDSKNLEKEEILSNLNKIVNTTTELSSVIESFNRITHIKDTTEEFDINETLDSICGIINPPLHEAHIELVVQKIGVNSIIKSNQSDIVNVVLHILSNAKEIIQERKIVNPQIQIIIEKKDNYLHIVISDNAGGIDEEVLPKIFDPYFTTKHQYSGTGIGLYTCNNIIQNKLLGTLSAHNTDIGAQFIIKLPLP
jgi:PAS domain S-box-containing protein